MKYQKTYNGQAIWQDDENRWHWGNRSYGTYTAITQAIDEEMGRPKVTWQEYRGHSITHKVWPHGGERWFCYKHEFRSLAHAQEYVEHLFGPDVAAAAMANIKESDHSAPFTLSKDQVDMVQRLANAILESDGLGLAHMAGYEFKTFELTYGYGGRLYLVTEVGGKTDEGTMAAIFCRTRRHIVIGPRGGLESLNGPKSKRHGFRNVLIYGKSS